MAISKVVYNDATLIDISEDTVTRDKLAYGVTAHDKSGARIVGTVNMDGAGMIPTKVSDLENDLDFVTETEMVDKGYIQNGTNDDVTLNGNVAVTGSDALFKVIEVVAIPSQSVASKEYADGDVDVNAGDGWTPIAIAGHRLYNRYFTPIKCVLENGQVSARICNFDTATHSTYLMVRVLCMRTSAS